MRAGSEQNDWAWNADSAAGQLSEICRLGKLYPASELVSNADSITPLVALVREKIRLRAFAEKYVIDVPENNGVVEHGRSSGGLGRSIPEIIPRNQRRTSLI